MTRNGEQGYQISFKSADRWNIFGAGITNIFCVIERYLSKTLSINPLLYHKDN